MNYLLHPYKLLMLPDSHHIELIQPMAGALEFVFLAFVGIAIVSTLLSVTLKGSNPELSKRIALAISGKISPWLALGVLPLATLALLLGQLVYGSSFGIFVAILKISPLAAVGFFAAWLYRHTWCRIAGTVAGLALTAFALPFVNLLEMLNWPERWPLLNPLAPNIYDAQGPVRAAIFFAGALLATGAALVFRGFVWNESRVAEDAPERNALRIWALCLTLAGAVALPVLVIVDSVMVPVGAQSFCGLAIGGAAVAALWLTSLLAASALTNGKMCGAALVSVLALAGLALETARENTIQTTAIADKIAASRMKAEAEFAKLKLDQEARYPSNVPLDAKAGERIYGEKCSTCHAFDHKVVGPAHKDVVPKYRGQQDKLVAFILAPQKVDPAFPAMPAQGLSRREAAAVADFLLKKLETETKGGGQ